MCTFVLSDRVVTPLRPSPPLVVIHLYIFRSETVCPEAMTVTNEKKHTTKMFPGMQSQRYRYMKEKSTAGNAGKKAIMLSKRI